MIRARRAIVSSVVLFGLGGCAQLQAAREEQYAARCAAMGIPVGSQQFLQCRLGLEEIDIARRAEARRGLLGAAAILQAAQPSAVPPYPYWIAPTLNTTCYRYGNQTQCSTH